MMRDRKKNTANYTSKTSGHEAQLYKLEEKLGGKID